MLSTTGESTMTTRFDAHMHLFETSFAESFTGRGGVSISEIDCYETYRKEFNIEQAIVVGYAAEPWCRENNEYLARLKQNNDWIQPAAFIDFAKGITIAALEGYKASGFIGVSIYATDPASVRAIAQIGDSVWRWIVDHHWLVSVNMRGDTWSVFEPVLQRHADLRLMVSHLGLPRVEQHAQDDAGARESLAQVTPLARYKQVRVKLSAFYAFSNPGHDYPHASAWPLVRRLIDAFGVERLLWGSDYSPHLDWVSFPQTLGVLEKMPFLNAQDRRLIEGGNLSAMLCDGR